MAKKIELLHTTYDESGNIESQEVVHPLTSPDCIIMENGRTLDEVMGDGIATPTLTHEGTSFKVGVGDSNIEVVDGDVAGMTLKGQSYQNILPKPTTLIMETDEQEFKINDKIDSNIIIDDNIAEIATVKGKTIVNTVQEESASEYVVMGQEFSGQGELVTENTVDGNIKGVTLQGQTLVNTIQEPCEDEYVVLGAEDGIEISAKTGGHGTIENTVQGGINGATLKGQTLVNLIDTENGYGMHFTHDGTIDGDCYTVTAMSHGQKVVVEQAPSSWRYFAQEIKLQMLKPRTKYFVSGEFQGISTFQFMEANATKPISIHGDVINNRYAIIETSGDLYGNITSQCLYGHISAIDSGSVLICNDVILVEYQEGMENWDIPYFEGIQSIKMPVLTTTGKNLFDLTGKVIYSENNLHQIQNNEVIMENTTYGYYNCRIQYFNLKPNERYIISYDSEILSGTPYKTVLVQDDQKNKLNNNNNNGMFTAPLNGKVQLRFYSGSSNKMGKIRYYNIQLEEGSVATPYEPFKSNILTVNEPVELRGIGDVKDELNLLTGELTQRIGEIVLDGSEDEVWNTWITESDMMVWVLPKSFANLGSHAISDRYIVAGTAYGKTEETLAINPDNLRHIQIRLFKTTASDINELKTYLQSNPITIQYQLAAPTVKTVDLTVTDQDGNTIPHIQTQPTITHITASSNYLIPTVTIDNNLAYDTIIKPSTLYTVRFTRNTVNTDNPLTVDLGGTTQTVTSTEFTITTPSELTHNQLVFSGKNNVVSEVQVIEGDMTNIEYPFFEGINDVKFSDSKFIGRGKNLCPNIFIASNKGRINENNGSIYASSSLKDSVYVSDYIYIKGVEWLSFNRQTLNADGSAGTHSYAFYDCNKRFISGAYNITPIKVPNNAYYIRITIDSEQDFQIEESSTATSYEPYKCVEVQQDIDSIPLASDMFEQGGYNGGSTSIVKGMSVQQFPISQRADRIKSKTLVKVKPNTTYSINDLRFSAITFDKNGGYNGIIDFCTSFTTDSNTYYLGVNLSKTGNSDITPSDLDSMNLILQEVPQEIVLRGIGDVKDELDLTRGEYIQRIGEVVLDGYSSNITMHKSYSNGNISLRIKLANIRTSKFDVFNSVRCDNFEIKQFNTMYDFGEQCVTAVDAQYLENIYICITTAGLDTSTMANICKYFESKPTKIQYILETPIIHKVNLTNTKVIPSYATETHYETITPSDSLIPNITIPSTLNYDVAIKPSTEYTIRANTSDNLTVDLGGATGTLSNGKVTLTTPATLTHNEVKFSGTGKVKELMVVEDNEIKDNVPFFNGMKNVEMGGIKLVNHARYNGLWNNLSSTTNNRYVFNGDGTDKYGVIFFNNETLKPNTLYTIYMIVETNTSTTTNAIKVCLGDDTQFKDISNTTTGIVKLLMTSPSIINTRSKPYITIRKSSANTQVIIKNPMIIEGDWTHLDEIPFIESEMIIEQPIIRSQGKNLFDKNKTVDGGWVNTNGSIIYSPDNFLYTMDVKPNTTYTASLDGTIVDATFFAEYSGTPSPSTFIRLVQTGSITTSSSTKKIILAYSCSEIYLDEQKNKIQIEEGSTATPYEPYKHQTLYSNRVIGYEEGVYYQHENGNKIISTNYNSIIADVEGLSVAYITHGHSNFSFWDKDGVYISGKPFMDTNRYGDANNNGFITVPSNAKYIKFPSGNSTVVSCKYTDTTVTGDLPLRSLPNGVCDTLNLVTGEYVQRVGEVVLDGSDASIWRYDDNSNNALSLTLRFYTIENAIPNLKSSPSNTLNNGGLIDLSTGTSSNDNEHICAVNNRLYVRMYGTRFGNNTTDFRNAFVTMLSQNPITVQYELATPIVRKLGFTTKGNYTEFTMDETKTWRKMDKVSDKFTVTRYACQSNKSYKVGNIGWVDNLDFISKNMDGEGYDSITTEFCYIMIDENKLSEDTIDGFKQWLSQNPFKASYLTNQQSSESYSNIHKPIFFNNVNVQFLPYNLDIQPQLTLQARTKNSYVMDMIKANTKYSIKLLNSSGNMKIDETSYTLANNRTFISPSTLINKELIISGGWYEPMIIEGDVTGKNLPYFKGILSSYHDVDEIEVYSYNSENHNTTLIEMPTRLETVKVVRPKLIEGALEITNGAECASTTEWRSNFIPVQPNEFIKVRNATGERLAHIDFYDINKNFISYSGVVNATYVPDNCYFIRFFMSKANSSGLTITRQAWKPIQLNSLPNGVCDEIIMKPNSNKAQLVQRVGKVVLDGIYYRLSAYASEVKGDDISCTYSVLDNVAGGICQSDKLLSVSYSQDYKNIECIMLGTNSIVTSMLKTRAYNAGEYAKENPITVYYELATPIIHEIQLKGYPHVYENGTVTLNTDTPHQTLVSYNVNQEQLINTQNETIIRHDQQIDDLYYYIEMYLEEIYQMELFRMKLELSL